jgi:hypothetical protein
VIHPTEKTIHESPGDIQPCRKPLARGFRSRSIYSILILAMTKRKPSRFSVTKAVKANARERVGQPKPARVIETEPRTGREIKHKPKLEEIIRQEE